MYARVYSRARYVSGRVGTLSVKCGERPRPVGDPDVGAKSRKLKVAGAKNARTGVIPFFAYGHLV